MACCILILLWVQDELSFDKFHEHGDDLYNVATWHQFGSERSFSSGSPPALAPALKTEYPEVINSGRIQNGSRTMLVRYGDKIFREEVRFGDSSLFEMFSFPLIKGDPRSVLGDPHSLAVSAKMAAKYFSEEDPIGKVVTLDNKYDFKVTGVFKDIPENSILSFEFIGPLEFLRELIKPNFIDTWYNCSFTAFVQLAPYTDYQEFSEKISGRVKEADKESTITPFLYPYTKLYLHGLLGYGSRIQQVRMFALIALLILLIACINFMNLTTARAGNRAREVGMRKVVGAQRKDIIYQFFGEAILLSLIAFFMSLILVKLILPAFRDLTGKSLFLSSNLAVLIGIVCIAIFAGIVSGSYPAFLLSSFKPARVLKGALKSGPKGAVFRKILVVTQFSVSIALIIGTIVVFNQLNYMRNRDLGLNKEQVVYIPLSGNLNKMADVVKKELLRHPNILQATMSSHVPTGIYWNGSGWDWEGRPTDVDTLVTYMSVHLDFLETFQMEMAEGRFYNEESKPNTRDVVINENFARIISDESPVGKRLSAEDDDLGMVNFRIIGVIKDFHFKPLDRRLEPIILFYKQDWIQVRYIFMRIRSGNVPQTIAHLEKTYQKFNPDFPFEYRFLDEDYDRLYRSQVRLGKIVRIFAVLAVVISCLGLFGLASFLAAQRTKEIGIRKVLGASVPRLVILLTKEFTKWVLVANIIAWPIVYYVMKNWLKDYAYRTGIGIEIFLLTALTAFVIALFTVSYQAVRAAVANPADSLRYE